MPSVSHEKLVEENKPEYYLSLRRSQKTFKKENEDITAWLSFFLSILCEQSKQAVNLLSHSAIEKLLSEKQLAIWKYLGTVEEAGSKEIVEKTGIVRPTVNQALTALLKVKKIERIGLGRSTRYRRI